LILKRSFTLILLLIEIRFAQVYVLFGIIALFSQGFNLTFNAFKLISVVSDTFFQALTIFSKFKFDKSLLFIDWLSLF